MEENDRPPHKDAMRQATEPATDSDGFPKMAPGRRLQWEQRQKATVLLYPEGMVTLSESAADILRLCDGRARSSEIAARLAMEFESDEVGQDVLAFLQEARAHGWIRIAPAI